VLKDEPGFEDPRPVREWILFSEASLDQMRAFLKAVLIVEEYDKIKEQPDDVIKHRTAVEAVKLKTKLLEYGDDYFWSQMRKDNSTTAQSIEKLPSWIGWKGFWLEQKSLKQMKISGELLLTIAHLVPAVLALIFLCDNHLFVKNNSL
jgi:hypothetical protein